MQNKFFEKEVGIEKIELNSILRIKKNLNYFYICRPLHRMDP